VCVHLVYFIYYHRNTPYIIYYTGTTLMLTKAPKQATSRRPHREGQSAASLLFGSHSSACYLVPSSAGTGTAGRQPQPAMTRPAAQHTTALAASSLRTH
jgi:hypothetical protein